LDQCCNIGYVNLNQEFTWLWWSDKDCVIMAFCLLSINCENWFTIGLTVFAEIANFKLLHEFLRFFLLLFIEGSHWNASLVNDSIL
jgi:hypothetical protein